ncbi:putative secreted protein [Wickerhamomyces ciferrii]|uniref:Secreted protein n=1 Tax=Wickerhamomyces ciferrii (strain ATCC 14091 / BCRC 22168 / CBS 111 / JCM 3599 / NBRC 0793 / NRRL Y-1031 F-60-10) TaxID=1206466 RepID=K0KUD0_WICCF|nr:uncharacterized protein BN7_4622 [Wickerhamomyces ciferrii]CCH45044.1 putative secreted protein [Wickerhamomyces ciferrii]
MWKLVASVVLVLWISSYLYSLYLDSQKDIHELALKEQSNISPTRKEDETAIYRNNQTPHGLPLTTGLQVRHGFKLRNGNLRDVWSVIMSKKNINNLTFLNQGIETIVDIYTLNSAIGKVASFAKEHNCQTIGTTAPLYSFEGFVTTIACFVNGLTIHNFNHLPRSTPKDIDLMIIPESELNFALKLNFKLILVICEDRSKTFKQSNLINWSILGDLFETKLEKYEYKYKPEYDDGTPYIETHNFKTTSYSHQNFVSSIAATTKELPLGHELNNQDKILIGYESSSVKYLSKILTILLFGGSIVLGNSNDSIFKPDLIGKYSITILAVDSNTAKRFFLNSETLKQYNGLINSILFKRAQYLLGKGIFTQFASLSKFKTLRLIYIDQLNEKNQQISIPDLNKIRVISNARIITERYFPGVIGPILSTNFYDYRIFTNPKLKNRGTSSLSLELKLFKYKDLDIEKRNGELCIRGFIIGKPSDHEDLINAIQRGEEVGSEGWMPTGIIGKLGVDGCFYES